VAHIHDGVLNVGDQRAHIGNGWRRKGAAILSMLQVAPVAEE
jgi:hypothetical protein